MQCYHALHSLRHYRYHSWWLQPKAPPCPHHTRCKRRSRCYLHSCLGCRASTSPTRLERMSQQGNPCTASRPGMTFAPQNTQCRLHFPWCSHRTLLNIAHTRRRQCVVGRSQRRMRHTHRQHRPRSSSQQGTPSMPCCPLPSTYLHGMAKASWRPAYTTARTCQQVATDTPPVSTPRWAGSFLHRTAHTLSEPPVASPRSARHARCPQSTDPPDMPRPLWAWMKAWTWASM